MSKIKPLARRTDIVVQEFGNETLIYDLIANKAFNLNKTSTLIWQSSNGDKNITEIADAVSKKLNSSINEEFVWLAIEQLKKENLIENKNEIPSLYQDVSRREIIKRVGLASLVALPIVSSLVAPVAINAQSVACTTTPPGGLQCRCIASEVPSVGDNCGTNYASGDICNAGCVCRRTAASCPAGPYTGTGIAGTCQGSCVSP